MKGVVGVTRTTCRPGREATRGFARYTPQPGTIKRAMYCLLLLRSPDNKLLGHPSGNLNAAKVWSVLNHSFRSNG